MKDEDKTREELIKELAIMRQQVTELREREMADNHAKTVEIYRKKLGNILRYTEDICYEITQPMHALLGYTDLLLINTAVDNPAYEKLNIIKKQTLRISNLTKKLMQIRNYEFQDAGVSEDISN